MVDPVSIATAGAGLLGGVLKLADNPIIAWFLVLTVLSIDTLVAGVFTWGGVVGAIVGVVVNQFSGANLVIYSWQILFLVAISPVILWILDKATHR